MLNDRVHIVENVAAVLHVIICEDEPEELRQLKELLENLNLPTELRVEAFSSAARLLEDLKRREKEELPDIIISDIEMPDMDGISFGKALRELMPAVYLVLLTAYEEYAVKGYETRAYRYLLKPPASDVICRLLQEILAKMRGNAKLCMTQDGEESRVDMQDVLYLSAEDKYTVVYAKEAHFLIRKSLSELEEKLLPYGFYRIHRKYIINCYHYQSLRNGTLCLGRDIRLPVSRRRQAGLKEYIITNM